MKILITLLCLIISFLIFALIHYLSNSRIEHFLEGILKKRKGYFSYERTSKYIIQKGSPLHLTPVKFFIFKFLFSILFLLVGLDTNVFVGVSMCIIGFFIPDLLIEISDKQDNRKIISDLSPVYDCLRIQTKAGVFITTALTECYLIAKNKRMKKALSELTADLMLRKDLDNAINKFNNKFDSSYIDSFCITIKQGAASGRSVQALDDLSLQIKEINSILEKQMAEKVKRRIVSIQLAVFIGITLILAYAIFLELTRNLILF